jgi:long-chain acyl-CoA synthetase
LNLKKEDKLLLTTPAYHSFCSGLFIAAIYVGASVVFLPKLDASELEHIIDVQQPTVVAGVPYVLRMMQRFSGRGFEKIRMCIAGGAPLSKEIVHYFKAKFNILVCQEYGLSEAGILTINLDPLRFPASVGQAIPGVELEITEAGQIVANRLDAPNRFIGDSSENVFLGSGKILTGDLGRLAAQNFLYLEGREKFIINIAGNKVAPREVEDVLNTIPCVMDSFVFPINEGSEDEAVGAVVLVKDSINLDVISIKKHCLVRLTIWKIPRRIEIVREIPTTSTGKPDLKAIKRLLQ